MRLVLLAMRRPVTVLVALLAVALMAILAIRRMTVDIFPNLGAPAIYVAQPYGGMDPSQMEGFLTYYYEYHFLYITGIEHVESKNIQGAALMKLGFHPGTDMSQAMAQVVSYVNRARAFMPPGAVPPFIVRYDAGSVPVGQLVFSSPSRSPSEMQDIALNRVRPLFATLSGVSAPPPFGGNQRTIVVRLNPERLREYHLSPEEAVAAVNQASVVMPSGNIRTGDLNRVASTNSVVGGNLQDLMDAPVRTGSGPAVYLRDIGVAENGTDIVTGYAHVDGRRTVYIPVTKRADAGTLAVIQRVRAAIPDFQRVVPDDVKISLEFDQSRIVSDAIRNLVREGLLGAFLTGLVVLIFIRDWRSALIVVLTIPFALLSAVVALWFSGQSINIMTLGGLALAVGVLVDEATVEIENINARQADGDSQARRVIDACRRTAGSRLLAMLCLLSVFVSSFFMAGVGRQLFVPLSLAVGFAMVASYVLSSTLVPVLSTWLLRQHEHESKAPDLLHRAYTRYIGAVLAVRWLALALYAAAAALGLYLLLPRLGTEIFPESDVAQVQLRLRAPTGTRIERTELITLHALDIIKRAVGPDQVVITTDFVGVQPASYPVNTIYLWTSGPQEAVIRIALKPDTPLRGEALREMLRDRLRRELPEATVSFEAGDIVGQVMSFGSPTPIEVAVQGPSLTDDRKHAEKIRKELAGIGALRDLSYGQPLDYPTMEISVDRERAGQFGLTTADVTRSLVAATSSSRYIDPNYWRDPNSGNAFQIQVEIPQSRIASAEDVRELPLGGHGTRMGDVATMKYGTAMGEVDRYNMQRVVSLTANLHGEPLGRAALRIRDAVARAGAAPKGANVQIRGQIPALEETLSGLRIGLLLSASVVFLLLTASFQSFRISLAILSTIPAVLCGVASALLLTGTTLNVQSYMGAIMAIGISVANAILFVSFAERERRSGHPALEAASVAAQGRLRAILMTALSMIAGMAPIAAGLGEGARQTAPLAVAVIGGLVFATIATLTTLPVLYSILQGSASPSSASLDPSDPESKFYEAAA